MRVLIVHNVLWAHYKSLLFSKIAQQLGPSDELLVIQMALTEGHRKGLGTPDPATVGYPFRVLHNGPLEALTTRQRLVGLVRASWAFRPDVVLLTGWYDPAQLLLGMLLKLRGCRLVLQSESTALDNPRTDFRESVKRWFVQQCDAFFCFGTRAAEYLTQLGAPPHQILVRNNAVVDNAALARTYAESLPTRTQRQAELDLQPRNLIYVGRLAEEKNLLALLDALERVYYSTPRTDKWGLILLGEGDQKAALQRRADELKISHKVRFLPGCDWADVPRYLALADALVLPSTSEPWGLVVNEAMACGLPVLVSEHCGCAVDLVEDGKNGYTFRTVGFPSQLVERMRLIMTSPPEKLAKLGEESRRIIQRFDPDVVGKAMYDALKKISGR